LPHDESATFVTFPIKLHDRNFLGERKEKWKEKGRFAATGTTTIVWKWFPSTQNIEKKKGGKRKDECRRACRSSRMRF